MIPHMGIKMTTDWCHTTFRWLKKIPTSAYNFRVRLPGSGERGTPIASQRPASTIATAAAVQARRRRTSGQPALWGADERAGEASSSPRSAT